MSFVEKPDQTTHRRKAPRAAELDSYHGNGDLSGEREHVIGGDGPLFARSSQFVDEAVCHVVAVRCTPLRLAFSSTSSALTSQLTLHY